VGILDADKEGFLRSERSLIQTIGRAARNVNGTVLMYADTVTDSMRRAIDETDRRRRIQSEYNEEHDIEPQTIKKAIDDPLLPVCEADYVDVPMVEEEHADYVDLRELPGLVRQLRDEMRQAARALEFERAAELRDRIVALETQDLGIRREDPVAPSKRRTRK